MTSWRELLRKHLGEQRPQPVRVTNPRAILVGYDESGHITPEEMQAFLNELDKLCPDMVRNPTFWQRTKPGIFTLRDHRGPWYERLVRFIRRTFRWQ